MTVTGVLAAGTWGSALAHLADRQGHQVLVWHRRSEIRRAMRQEGHHPGLETTARFSTRVTVVDSPSEVIGRAEVLISSPSSAGVDSIGSLIAGVTSANRDQSIISVTKGIDPHTCQRMSQLLIEHSGRDPHQVAVLSGPNFAIEVADGKPAGTVIAAADLARARKLQDLFTNRRFRVYTSTDIAGVEIAGGLKNVLALAVGIAHGMGVGYNAQAVLITRGLTEIRRLGLKLGAQWATFSGLAGMGDLILTCTSDLSRNRRTGYMLGQGKSLDDVLAETQMTVEGIRTTRAVHRLARELEVEMPICNQMYEVLFNHKPVTAAMDSLMSREAKPEFDPARVTLPEA